MGVRVVRSANPQPNKQPPLREVAAAFKCLEEVSKYFKLLDELVALRNLEMIERSKLSLSFEKARYILRAYCFHDSDEY
jgi:hypothetical protein